MKNCGSCKLDKPDEDFNWKVKDVRRQSYCKLCQAAYRKAHYEANHAKYRAKAKEWRFEQKRKFFAWLQTQSCMDCGETDFVLLDLDHTEDNKEGNVSQMIGSVSDERLWAEVAKCDVVCVKCHRYRTAERGDWYAYMRV